MKFLFIALTLVLIPHATHAGDHSVSCNKDKKKQTHRLEVGKKDTVIVLGEKGGGGYSWISMDGLKGESAALNDRAGGGSLQGFDIKAGKIRGSRAEYTFEYKRAWESTGTPISTCIVELTVE